MERSAPYALIAAFVLVGLAAAAGLLVWLTDYDPGRRTATYAVVFEDVSGLSLASEVRYNGLPVGEVASMALDPAGTGLIRVEIEVLAEVPLHAGSVARLSAQGVTGVAVVALEGGDPAAGPLSAGPEGVPVLTTGRGTVETLADEAPALLEEARALIVDLRGFATPENAGRVAAVLADLERGAAGLGEVGALAEDLGGIGRDLAPALRGLPAALARVEGAAAEAEALAAGLRGTFEDRGPILVAAAEATLADLASAAAEARARLEEAEGVLAATRTAGESAARLADAGTEAAHDLRDLAGRAAPLIAEGTAIAGTLDAALPGLIEEGRAVLVAARALTRDELPPLMARADAALEGIADASAAGRLRLEEAAPAVRAAADAAEGLATLASDGARIAAAADGVLADASAAATALRRDLPPALADVRAAAVAARDGAAGLPGMAEEARAALAAATRTADVARVQVAEVGAAARTLLDDAAPALDALGGAARAVGSASGEVEALARAVAPAAEGIAAAGTRLAGSAEAVAARIEPLAEEVAALIGDARAATGAARQAIGRADGVAGDLARAAPGLDRALRQATEAGEAVARLARRLERDPSVILRGR